ncbi:RNA polymerase sporulation sigma factor SigK [Massiliimalia massiliensis]|uniref:RNA polymerase sporulation sigma factor SigK n=1 Tax=Massiliimalia massiliensis TaxID=1852384 RepID=UPI000984F97F|nr:RNA polymerase sporulation sigma factor SigK [Massiliimalia massiliensis]
MLIDWISLIMERLLYLALHVEGIGTFPKPLSAEDEKKYFSLMQSGDEMAKGKLVEHNLRLVAHIAKKYYALSGDQDDLISIGTIGLIKAINTFSYDKGTRFATYASRCIENEILMHFRNVKKTASDVYISDPIDSDKDGNTLTLMDLVADETCMIDRIDLRLKSEKLYRFIASELDEREQLIIKLRYGLHGKRPLTQREIAKHLHISRSYVSRIEKKALLTLRKCFAGDEL